MARLSALEIGLVGWMGKRTQIQRNWAIRKYLQSFCGHRKEEAGACAEAGHTYKAAKQVSDPILHSLASQAVSSSDIRLHLGSIFGRHYF